MKTFVLTNMKAQLVSLGTFCFIPPVKFLPVRPYSLLLKHRGTFQLAWKVQECKNGKTGTLFIKNLPKPLVSLAKN